MKIAKLLGGVVLVLLALCAQAWGGEQAPVADVEVFKALLKSIDDGKGPGPIPQPSASGKITIEASQCLGITYELQRKDTAMLCLEGCPEHGANAWDVIQVDHSGHGSNYCSRASMKMINSYYGGSLSQDRITYAMLIENTGSNKRDLPPEYHLWHKHNSGNEALPWALGFAWGDWSRFTRVGVRPTYAQIKAWINAGRPVQTFVPGHSTVIDGWWEDGGVDRVHLLDPWCVWDGNESHAGMGWRDYNGAYMNTIVEADVCPTLAQVTSPRSDEATVAADSDADGIVDFDEIVRFGTNHLSGDTDGDGVPDKKEIRSYIFDDAGNHNLIERIGDIWVCKTKVDHGPCGYVYNPEATGVPWANLPGGWVCPSCGNAKAGFEQTLGPCLPYTPWDLNWGILDLVNANADCDGDGLRKEVDPDNDNDGALDGEEDKNGNGIYEPGLGETDPFDRNSYRFDNPYVLRASQDLMAASDIVVKKNMYVHGDLYCNGSKAVVRTKDYGRRMVFVDGSAESYHFDRGQSRLHNGAVIIHLDPVFLQTVVIGARYPPLIRLMPTADCEGLYVSRWAATHFTVKESGRGKSNATFNWEVAAKRAGHARRRLEAFEAGE